ncbi:MAG: WbuC family cupin fold metalloprotein [Lachnospiraceae bacterium]|nr:WbuC family cupin fold metalloprotein [Lachnospiraceae bacterium]
MEHIADFSKGDVVKVHSSQLLDFREIALNNNAKKRYRLCLHDSPENILQEMFICRTKGDYTRPDKHKGISESHTIIEGREAIILFSDDGEIIDSFILDRNGGYLSYRINADIYHMTIPLTDAAIDYETKTGPFTSESNIYPGWAPDGRDKEEASGFCRKILDKLKLND